MESKVTGPAGVRQERGFKMRTMGGTFKRVLPAAAVGLLVLAPAGSAGDGVEVQLCDGTSSMTVEGLAEGEILAREEAQLLADRMLQAWRKTQGESAWARWEAGSVLAARAAAPAAPAARADAPRADQPVKFSKRDQLLWKRAQDKWIAEGYRLYHSPTALGGTIGISCDMCHPDGANTHPETYPKFQVQLKKVALLRDMINWCIENPEKGKPLAEDDERMRAVEAYILSTRQGVPLEPGKH